MSNRIITRIIVLVAVTLLQGCTQTKSYVPQMVATPYELNGLPESLVSVEIIDLRPAAIANDGLKLVLKRQIIAAQPSHSACEKIRIDKIVVDIIEHRSFFTLGNWNASTRLSVKLEDSEGAILHSWRAVGSANRSNMWGHATARAVAQDSYDIAVADLISFLSGVAAC
jgi:hypothetical protein